MKLKISRFLGRAPKQSGELLPETMAQVARNCKLYSGDLIPYPEPVATGDTVRTGGVQTLYGIRDPDTSALAWLSWATPVKAATPSVVTDDEQRVYYTGDGVPKVTNYALATAGAGPYPTAAFRLGLPLPETKVTTTASAVPTATVSTVARATNQATIVTTAAHGLNTGSIISISGVPNLFGTYSQSTTTLTVTITAHGLTTNDTVTLQLSSSSSGTPVSGTYSINSTTTDTFAVTVPNSATDSGTAKLVMSSFNAPSVQVTVVDSTTFTFPSSGFSLAAKSVSGAKVTLSSFPVYRTYIYTWVSDWQNEESIGSIPSTEVLVREGQTVTVTAVPMTAPTGNYNVRGVRLYRSVTGITDAQYLRLKTLWFPTRVTNIQRLSNVVTVTTADRHKLAKDNRIKLLGLTSDTSFNGEGYVVTSIVDDYTFTFAQTDTDTAALSETAGYLYYDVSQRDALPAVYMTGTTFTDNFDSRLLFSAYTSGDYSPPPDQLEGLTAINDGMMVGFYKNVLYFSEPGKPHAWPRRYTITLEHPIVGLAPAAGALFVATEGYPYYLSGSAPNVMSVLRVDALYPCVSARSLVSMSYGVVYATNEGLAVFTTGGATLLTAQVHNSDTWGAELDPTTIVAEDYGDMYFASHSTGSFTFTPQQQVGEFVDCDDTFTAAFYDALEDRLYYTNGTAGVVYEWDNLDEPAQSARWKSKVMVTPNPGNLGAARVVGDYSSNSVTFRLYADKALKFTRTVTDSKMFRLPTGYRTDTYEVEVEGPVRVRSIHLADTPQGLKEV